MQNSSISSAWRRFSRRIRTRRRFRGAGPEQLEDRTLLSRQFVYAPGQSTFLSKDDGGPDDAAVSGGSGALDKQVKNPSMAGRIEHEPWVGVDRVWLDLSDDGEWQPGEPYSSGSIDGDDYTDFALTVDVADFSLDVLTTKSLWATFSDATFPVQQSVDFEIVSLKFVYPGQSSKYSFGSFAEGCTGHDIGSVTATHYRNSSPPVYGFDQQSGDNTGGITYEANTSKLISPAGLDYEAADQGTFSFHVKATSAGEVAVAPVDVAVTNVTPSISITQPGAYEASVDQWPTVAWTATHPATPYSWELYRTSDNALLKTGTSYSTSVNLNHQGISLEYGTYRFEVEGDNCLGEPAEDSVVFRVQAAPVFMNHPDDIEICECEDGEDGTPHKIPVSEFRVIGYDPDDGGPIAHNGILSYAVTGPQSEKFEIHATDEQFQLWVTGDIDSEQQNTLNLKIRITDNNGQSAESPFTVTITDKPELPPPGIENPSQPVISLSDLVPDPANASGLPLPVANSCPIGGSNPEHRCDIADSREHHRKG